MQLVGARLHDAGSRPFNLLSPSLTGVFQPFVISHPVKTLIGQSALHLQMAA